MTNEEGRVHFCPARDCEECRAVQRRLSQEFPLLTEQQIAAVHFARFQAQRQEASDD